MARLRIVAVNDVYLLDHLPRLASLVRHHATHDPADAFLVTLAGDFLAPSILSSLDGGRGMVDCLNHVPITHAILGNHEDDLEPDVLRARLRELGCTVISTNVHDFEPKLVPSAVVDVAGTRVGLLGVVDVDPTLYRRPPFGGVRVEPAHVAARREADRLLAEGCAFVVPITHQRVADDRALAASRPVFPLILGGHEHDALLEDRDGTVLVKAPADAVAAAILDVEIGEGAPKVHARFEAVSLYPEDPELRARADRHLQRVRELETATLYFLPEGGHGGEVLSSVGTRVQQTSMGTLTCSRLRDALGAEACVFNGGGIRGSRAYQGQLTYGDLKTEVPFDNEIVVVRMPGRVLRDAIAHSRAKAPRESGGFLQVDDGVVVDARHQVVSVGGSPLDPERRYRVATVRNLFEGMDHVTPFVDFAQAEPAEIPMKTSGRDVKVVLVGAFSELLWEQLGGFPAIDRDRDGRVTASEILEAIARKAQAAPSPMAAQIVLDALDGDRDGVITAAGPRDLT